MFKLITTFVNEAHIWAISIIAIQAFTHKSDQHAAEELHAFTQSSIWAFVTWDTNVEINHVKTEVFSDTTP